MHVRNRIPEESCQGMQDLISACIDAEPDVRPHASSIVSTLQQLQRDPGVYGTRAQHALVNAAPVRQGADVCLCCTRHSASAASHVYKLPS